MVESRELIARMEMPDGVEYYQHDGNGGAVRDNHDPTVATTFTEAEAAMMMPIWTKILGSIAGKFSMVDRETEIAEWRKAKV